MKVPTLFSKGFRSMVIKTKDCLEKDLITLSNDKFFDWSKLKAFAGDKIKVTKKLKFVSRRKNMGKGETVGYQHFLLFQQCFFKRLFNPLPDEKF